MDIYQKEKLSQNSSPAYRYGGGRRKQTRSEVPEEESFTYTTRAPAAEERAEGELVQQHRPTDTCSLLSGP